MKEVNRMLHLRKKQNKRKRMARLLQALYQAAPRDEIELIVLRAKGLSDREIAGKSHLTEETVSRRIAGAQGKILEMYPTPNALKKAAGGIR